MDKITIETDGDDLESWDIFSICFCIFGGILLLGWIAIIFYNLIWR